ncbi:hypothetical protein CC2G_000096 [Coprinopsis cinerea AmutBmut pab1-1]|nr:hypothetical protein CC2G_000096 [Coprinopsis cinerea AmutBmut pab1-1]
MQYLWERWNGSKALALPPKVLAWDSSFNNDVGTPPGHRLCSRWVDPQREV